MQLNSPQYMNNVYNPQGFYPQQYGNYAPYQQIQQQRFQPQEQYPAMQNQQAIGLNGRTVQVVENINANEVPMDGSMAFFPKQDLSEIYVKGWNADGTIKTIVYKPQIDNKSMQAVNIHLIRKNSKLTYQNKPQQALCNALMTYQQRLSS